MCAFLRNRSLVVDSATEAPEILGVKFQNACTWRGRGSAIHVLNQHSGGPVVLCDWTIDSRTLIQLRVVG
jgi:hypothetical protein